MLDGVRELLVAKGKKVLRFDMVGKRPGDDEILELIVGRSGRLRAPAVRAGDKLLVGYNAELFEEHLL